MGTRALTSRDWRYPPPHDPSPTNEPRKVESCSCGAAPGRGHRSRFFSRDPLTTSAVGQSRPSDDLQETSAFAPTAEVRAIVGYRRFVPILLKKSEAHEQRKSA